MTFAITTKSGRSVNISAANYKEAQWYAEKHFGKGCIVQLVGNSANGALLNAKFNVGQVVKHKNGDTGVIEVVNPTNGFGDYMVRIVAGHGGFRGKASWDEKDLSVANSVSANSVVAEAVANARAANAGVKTVKVTLETVTFNQGVKVETRFMSVAELKTLLKMLGQGGDADAFVARLEQKGGSDIAIASPDLYAALI